MLNLYKLKPQHYLTGAIVIGFMQIIDGLLALSGYRSSLATAFSLLEMLWLLVSLIYVLAFQKQLIKPLIPMMYIGYYIFSWLYGSYLLSQKSTGELLTLPAWFMALATGFGLSYCVLAYLFYKKSYL